MDIRTPNSSSDAIQMAVQFYLMTLAQEAAALGGLEPSKKRPGIGALPRASVMAEEPAALAAIEALTARVSELEEKLKKKGGSK